MLAWKSGFALVIASSERELKPASPKQGIVTIAPITGRAVSRRDRTVVDGKIKYHSRAAVWSRLVLAGSEALPRVLIQVLAASFGFNCSLLPILC